jgi:hypothetical protein
MPPLGSIEETEPEPVALSAPKSKKPTGGSPRTKPVEEGEDDSRLAAVEQSMTDLTDAVRQELSLLRQALLNQKDHDED